ncbi:MAG: nuclear transport factor 2 family protein, partial [Porticoccaceae bacterium]|nr:nuclear transport factor 2 family protein [Porticoccaceae bacterium]
MPDIDRELQEMLDRHKIYQVLTRYCRGVDRGDAALIKSVYHDDAIDDHGMFKGLGKDFADWIV